MPLEAEHRLYDLKLGGGALLDIGIYTITFAQWLMQTPPIQIAALSHLGPTGVDERTGIVLRYPKGQVLTLNSAITCESNREAWIFGSKGSIKMPSFWRSEEIILSLDGQQKLIKMPHRINGYEGEIEEANRCLNANKIQSDIFPWSESLTVMQIMDQVRAQIGLRYPSDG